MIVAAVLIVYLLIAGSQGIRLIQTGQPVAIGFGVAILILPLIGFWIVWRELNFGNTVERMAKVLEAEGELPVDDLPRTQGGQIDRDAADAQFADVQKYAHKRVVNVLPKASRGCKSPEVAGDEATLWPAGRFVTTRGAAMRDEVDWVNGWLAAPQG